MGGSYESRGDRHVDVLDMERKKWGIRDGRAVLSKWVRFGTSWDGVLYSKQRICLECVSMRCWLNSGSHIRRPARYTSWESEGMPGWGHPQRVPGPARPAPNPDLNGLRAITGSKDIGSPLWPRRCEVNCQCDVIPKCHTEAPFPGY